MDDVGIELRSTAIEQFDSGTKSEIVIDRPGRGRRGLRVRVRDVGVESWKATGATFQARNDFPLRPD